MNAPDMLRGHAFLPPCTELAAIPRLYATEATPLPDKTLHLHYFAGACDWWVAELDADHRIAFGYVDLGDPASAEWGYVDLDELRGIAVARAGQLVVVERDLYWTLTTFANLDRSTR